jgi:hypothetical protein
MLHYLILSKLNTLRGNHVSNIIDDFGGKILEFDYHEPMSELNIFQKDGSAWIGVIDC